jgi:hypothetical protein
VHIDPPPGGRSIFDHEPALFDTFNRLYGTLWTLGDVDQATKEAARLRNAQLVDCAL